MKGQNKKREYEEMDISKWGKSLLKSLKIILLSLLGQWKSLDEDWVQFDSI